MTARRLWRISTATVSSRPPSGTFVRDHPGHAERGDREARRHRAELREADGGPEEKREEEVGVAPEPAEEDEPRARPASAASTTAPSARRLAGMRSGGRVAQTRISGATRRAPVASPSHQSSQRDP